MFLQKDKLNSKQKALLPKGKSAFRLMILSNTKWCFINRPKNQWSQKHHFASGDTYIVPVTTTVETPGVTVQAPVVGSCVIVAAGTVIAPGAVAKEPVASS